MKKSISLLFVAAVVTLVACGVKKSDLVVGSRKISDASASKPNDVPDSLKSVWEAQMKMQAEAMKKSTAFDFNKDGSFSVKMLGQENKGTWKLNDDGSKIFRTMDGRTDTANVVEISASKMVFESEVQGQKIKMVLSK